jgi:hypothetical protein
MVTISYTSSSTAGILDMEATSRHKHTDTQTHLRPSFVECFPLLTTHTPTHTHTLSLSLSHPDTGPTRYTRTHKHTALRVVFLYLHPHNNSLPDITCRRLFMCDSTCMMDAAHGAHNPLGCSSSKSTCFVVSWFQVGRSLETPAFRVAFRANNMQIERREEGAERERERERTVLFSRLGPARS